LKSIKATLQEENSESGEVSVNYNAAFSKILPKPQNTFPKPKSIIAAVPLKPPTQVIEIPVRTEEKKNSKLKSSCTNAFTVKTLGNYQQMVILNM